MFGIGGGELIFIIFIALMLFGADKIPDIARTLGKGMAQLKNATNDIKSEIQNSTTGKEITQMTTDFSKEVESIKQNVQDRIMKDAPVQNSLDITKEIDEVKESFEDLTGPIKRQM
ncbi:Sec-independent protein translocase subunit TatA/TatB [Flavobacterium oreochromis]|uniref:Sec-independent protein translocase protein TatA n=2 Tax=Flavobacterium TaxID=237 RepID=A0A246GAQ3_9FLAO|nr:twin-arginine translocase TatA/TatE family subunit [Flavobacterium oreochromis]OWP77207.1 Sec-independent protein translocase TatA [Flavobacterium oreochromis]OWP77476.1 Sec-independent protein translocase TatA [Flavobacterium oreochromis]POR27538.1 Sec-independent protein translocase TatA [Flavobacterium columnare]QYS87666.1 twin-arginine translocase TatA/TatE family subunit [Flavobacterium oreochromis]